MWSWPTFPPASRSAPLRMWQSGFIINGDSPKEVMVRALGPSLTPFGVAGALSDPMLDLRDDAGNQIATNDNWKDSQEQAIVDTGFAPANDSESAILATLPPGNYTAIVNGNGGAT